MAQAGFDARIITLSALIRLSRIDASDERIAETRGITQRVTDCCDGAIGARSFLSLR